mgnify:CR=1 FL=1
MLNDLMAEIKTDKKKKIETNKNVNVNVASQMKQSSKQTEEDEIKRMLA